MLKRALSPPNQIRSRRDRGVRSMENGDVSYQVSQAEWRRQAR